MKRKKPEKTRVEQKAPEYLDPVARGEWSIVKAALEALGIWHEADRSLVALYCATFSTWRRAADQVTAEGAVVKIPTAAGTIAKRNPYDVIRETSAAQCLRLLRQMGLTPTSSNRTSNQDQDNETLDEKRERLVRLFTG